MSELRILLLYYNLYSLYFNSVMPKYSPLFGGIMVVQNKDKEIAKKIGRTIAEYRQATGLTQAQVAEILDISNDAVSRMERGDIMPL